LERLFNTREYKRSRHAYTAECAFEYFATILVTDAFLAKLLKQIGLSDASVGVLSSLVSVSFLFQLFSVLLMQRMRNVKRTVLLVTLGSQILFLGVYLVPFLPVPGALRGAAAAVGILGGYALRDLVASVMFRWGNSFVDPRMRGEYSAVKEMISLLSGIVFTLAAGFLFDRFEQNGDPEGGFLMLGAAMLLSSAAQFVCLCVIGRGETEEREHRPLGEVLRALFSNRAFLKITLLACLWYTAQYLSLGFLGTYKTVDLAFSVGTVQIVNTSANLCRFFISRPFGRYSDRTSYARGFRTAMLMAAAAFAVCCFVTPGTRWLIVVHTVLLYTSYAGSNQNAYNMIYSYVEPEFFVQAMAIRASVAGIVGFGASLVGGKILSAVQDAGNRVLGFPIRGQQLLAFLSCLLALVCAGFTAFVVEKQRAEKR
ncbi:MAG: MFS transporter, partial [Clostridia bacterium]|nr:MFS transporter [Clostridia bacterium]